MLRSLVVTNEQMQGEKRRRRFINKGITGLVTPPKVFRKYFIYYYSEQPSHPFPPQSVTLSPPVCYKEGMQSEFPVLISAAFVHYKCVLLSAIPI